MDDLFPPVETGSYIVIFGAQGSGKSTLALHMAKEQKERVLFVSLEMRLRQISRVYSMRRSNTSMEDYRRGNVNSNVGDYAKELQNIDFLSIEDDNELTVVNLEAFFLNCPHSIIFIDNLDKLKYSTEEEGELAQENAVSSRLLAITRKTGKTIVILHHKNKGSIPSVVKKNGELIDKAKGNILYSGGGGMRGSNKILDDVDMALEIARPTAEQVYLYKKEEGDSGPSEEEFKKMVGIAIVKDREWGTYTQTEVVYRDGLYYPPFNNM